MPLSDTELVELEAEMLAVAGINAGQVWRNLQSNFIEKWDELRRAGLSDEEIYVQMEAHLEGLSKKPIEKAARAAATIAYSEGRQAEMELAADVGRATHAVVSEILDNVTCDVCRLRDGMVLEIGSQEYDENMPPVNCEGGSMCRGFAIALTQRA